MYKHVHTVVRGFIAMVWVVNGLLCKVLNLVPRHEKIVAVILGEDHAPLLTKVIGVAEIGMSIWIFSGVWRRVNAVVQMLIIAVMNILEYILAPGLLLWGKMNIVFAILFILVIYYNEIHFEKRLAQQV